MKKLGKWKQLLICIFILPLIVLFPSGCDNSSTTSNVGQNANNTYTVHFFTGTQETFNISSQTVAHGSLVQRPPETPKRNGYVFIGWYKDIDCTLVWTFEIDVVTQDMTLYARWQKRTE